MAPHKSAVRVRPGMRARTRLCANAPDRLFVSARVRVCLLKPASSLGPAFQVESICLKTKALTIPEHL